MRIISLVYLVTLVLENLVDVNDSNYLQQLDSGHVLDGLQQKDVPPYNLHVPKGRHAKFFLALKKYYATVG